MLKNLVFIVILACLATSCSTLKPSASQHAASSGSSISVKQSTSDGNIQFISNIAIHPDSQQDKSGTSITSSNVSDAHSGTTNYASAEAIENLPALQFKYSILENASVE